MPEKRKAAKRAKKITTVEQPVERNQTSKQKKKYFIFGCIAVLVLILLFVLRSFFVAALVNGEPITRIAIVSQLEKQQGKQTLDALITETLIRQELKKQHITVPQSAVNSEIAKIETMLAGQHQTLDQALKAQGMTKAELEKQLMLQKQLEVLLSKGVTISNEEIQNYMTQNQASMPAATDSAAFEQEVRQQIIQQKIGQKYQSWIDNLKKQAHITYFVQY